MKQQFRFRVIDFFYNLTRGLSHVAWRDLLECGVTTPQVYFYLENSRSVRLPEPGEICWVVEYLISKFHSKHVFPPRCPSLDTISRSIAQWEHRMRWRLALEREAEVGGLHKTVGGGSNPSEGQLLVMRRFLLTWRPVFVISETLYSTHAKKPVVLLSESAVCLTFAHVSSL